uniref:Uncharacterized protein n=1 Tax=Psilocybe cubensis TaxID=181762 RepID=A0A8H7XUE5_PSICU
MPNLSIFMRFPHRVVRLLDWFDQHPGERDVIFETPGCSDQNIPPSNCYPLIALDIYSKVEDNGCVVERLTNKGNISVDNRLRQLRKDIEDGEPGTVQRLAQIFAPSVIQIKKEIMRWKIVYQKLNQEIMEKSPGLHLESIMKFEDTGLNLNYQAQNNVFTDATDGSLSPYQLWDRLHIYWSKNAKYNLYCRPSSSGSLARMGPGVHSIHDAAPRRKRRINSDEESAAVTVDSEKETEHQTPCTIMKRTRNVQNLSSDCRTDVRCNKNTKRRRTNMHRMEAMTGDDPGPRNEEQAQPIYESAPYQHQEEELRIKELQLRIELQNSENTAAAIRLTQKFVDGYINNITRI